MLNKLGIIILLFFVGNLCLADSWAEPEIENVFSKNKRYLLQIKPAREKNPPIATVYEITKEKVKDTSKKMIYQARLVNSLAPVSAIISNDGENIITFDEWGQVGTSENVVVIYKRDKLLKRYKLSDFLTDEEINLFDRSVSSVWWYAFKEIDENARILRLKIATSLNETGKIIKKILINLKTGTILK